MSRWQSLVRLALCALALQACSIESRALVSSDVSATDGGGSSPDASIGSDATVGCTSDAQCVPADPCHVGKLVCGQGTSSCKDTGTVQGDGTPCGAGKVCAAGACQACDDGAACTVPQKPCRTAKISCSTGKSICTEMDNAPEGAPCGAGMACSNGSCVACVEGATCMPTNHCHAGTLSCAGAMPDCKDQGTNLDNGATCGVDQVCKDGACAACKAGASCTVSNPCRAGTLACNTGSPLCVEGGNAPNGMVCGASKTCKDGACVDCSAGATCTPVNKCHTGTLSCAGGNVMCNDTGDAAAAGTSCGTDKVCSQGTCLDCAENKPCTPGGNACKSGLTSCKTGASICDPTGNAANGTACGASMVCSTGSCIACAENAACTPANPCHTGKLSCAGGTPSCSDTSTSLANGTSCGTNLVCSSGSCVPCTSNNTCVPGGNACKTGSTSCSTGTSTCVATGNVAGGTSCGANLVCSGGSCVTCNAGTSCQPSNPCHAGSLSCATGAPSCSDTGTNLTNGTSCGTNLVCSSGSCVACSSGAICTPVLCKTGTTSCSTGVAVCSATGDAIDGTACGAGKVCYQGACKAPNCTGVACGASDGAGGFCTDAKGTCPANQKCVNTACQCRGPTISCSDGTHFCGSWYFESGTPEGWGIDPDANDGANGPLSVTTARSYPSEPGGGVRAIAFGYTGVSKYLDVGIVPCGGGATADVSAIQFITAAVYLEPAAGQPALSNEDDITTHYFMPPYGRSNYVEANEIARLPSGQWYKITGTTSSSAPNVVRVNFEFHISTSASWTGTIYVDDIEMVLK